MPNKANPVRHEVSVSSLPSRLEAGRFEHGRLRWDKSSLKKRIQYVIDILCEQPSHVHIEFVDSVEIGALNWQFRGKDSPTDVLSFIPHSSALLMDADRAAVRTTRINLGELVICTDVCAEQCKRHRCTLSAEIERMIVHGLVHLRGFDHERSAASHAVMTALENSIRRQLQVEMGAPEFCTLSSLENRKKKREVRRR